MSITKISLAFGKDNMQVTYHKAILAGIVLGLASWMYLVILSLGNIYLIYAPFFKIIGAFIFSYGLVTIVNYKYYLYTGSIAKANVSYSIDWLRLIFCLLGNIIVLYLIGNVLSVWMPDLVVVADNLIAIKMTYGWQEIMMKSIGCGLFMYFAVYANNLAITSFSVAGFVLCGFEHCLADFFYFCASSQFTLPMFGFFLLALLGNTIGASIPRVVTGDIDLIALVESGIKNIKELAQRS